jgi:hypothetical protein
MVRLLRSRFVATLGAAAIFAVYVIWKSLTSEATLLWGQSICV